MFIFPIHFSHFQSMLICDPGSLATIIGIFLGPKGNKFLIHHTFLISENNTNVYNPLLIFFPFEFSLYSFSLLIFYSLLIFSFCPTLFYLTSLCTPLKELVQSMEMVLQRLFKEPLSTVRGPTISSKEFHCNTCQDISTDYLSQY